MQLPNKTNTLANTVIKCLINISSTWKTQLSIVQSAQSGRYEVRADVDVEYATTTKYIFHHLLYEQNFAHKLSNALSNYLNSLITWREHCQAKYVQCLFIFFWYRQFGLAVICLCSCWHFIFISCHRLTVLTSPESEL